MKHKLVVALFLTYLLAIPPAIAVVIVDTGPGTSNSFGPILASYQFLAVEFSLSATTSITAVQGWIGGVSPGTNGGNGTATAVIYADGGEIPGAQLFAAVFNGDVDFDFDGPTGLQWVLPANTYWLAFEVRAGQTLASVMPQPTSPLDNEAFALPGFNYFESDNLSIGVRISGEVFQRAILAEPPTFGLLACGISLLIFRTRKKNSQLSGMWTLRLILRPMVYDCCCREERLKQSNI